MSWLKYSFYGMLRYTYPASDVYATSLVLVDIDVRKKARPSGQKMSVTGLYGGIVEQDRWREGLTGHGPYGLHPGWLAGKAGECVPSYPVLTGFRSQSYLGDYK